MGRPRLLWDNVVADSDTTFLASGQDAGYPIANISTWRKYEYWQVSDDVEHWVELDFELIPHIKSVKAIVRFYLLDVKDKFRLYIYPPSISPADPAQTISSPASYSQELAEKVGPFYTLGLPADFNAIRMETFSMENYIVQSESVFKEGLKLFNYEFERFLEMKKGLLFYYFSSIDQGSHIFWALRDPLHPYHKSEEAKKFGDRIEALYREFDKIIGNVLKKLPSNIPLVILSDHGFAPLRRKVNLNTLLHENGFVRFNGEIDYMDATFIPNYANWNETRAFSIGLNGIYLNLKGREPNGIVKPEEKRAVLNDIKKMLLSVKDEKTGEHPIGNVFISEDNYARENLHMGADIIVGYNRNYALDSGSALGGVGKEAISDNLSRWSGDHIIDPRQVPALLLTNFKMTNQRVPYIWDLAPTFLKLFGITTPSDMRGKSLV